MTTIPHPSDLTNTLWNLLPFLYTTSGLANELVNRVSVLSLGYWTNLLSLNRFSTCFRGTRPYFVLRLFHLSYYRCCSCPVSVIDRRHSSKDLRWTRDSFLFSRSDAYRGNKERSLLDSCKERRFCPSAVSPPKAIRDGRFPWILY